MKTNQEKSLLHIQQKREHKTKKVKEPRSQEVLSNPKEAQINQVTQLIPVPPSTPAR